MTMINTEQSIRDGYAAIKKLQDTGFECVGGPLSQCWDWRDLVRCFEELSEAARRQGPADE